MKRWNKQTFARMMRFPCFTNIYRYAWSSFISIFSMMIFCRWYEIFVFSLSKFFIYSYVEVHSLDIVCTMHSKIPCAHQANGKLSNLFKYRIAIDIQVNRRQTRLWCVCVCAIPINQFVVCFLQFTDFDALSLTQFMHSIRPSCLHQSIESQNKYNWTGLGLGVRFANYIFRRRKKKKTKRNSLSVFNWLQKKSRWHKNSYK